MFLGAQLDRCPVAGCAGYLTVSPVGLLGVVAGSGSRKLLGSLGAWQMNCKLV